MVNFDNLNCLLLFLGRGRSGSSLCGGLLACHPNIILAHQKEFKHFVFEDETELYRLFDEAHRSKKFIWKPLRNLSGWSIMKDYDDIRVIGTKKQGTFITKIDDFKKLDELKKKISIPIKFINIYRNPFDNITTIYRKSQQKRHIKQGRNMKSLDKAITYYFHGIQMTQEVINREPTLNIQHEKVVTDVEGTLTKICDFLDLPLTLAYLNFCNTLIWEKPRISRHSLKWEEKHISRVNELKNKYDFLRDYELEM